jgi:chromosome partitioning protein
MPRPLSHQFSSVTARGLGPVGNPASGGLNPRKAGAKLQEWLRNQATIDDEVIPTAGEKVIALINMKGGVGKTTLSVNLAYALAKVRHKKILLVDVDPQFNATQYLLTDAAYLAHLKKGLNTVYNVFFDRPDTPVGTVTRKAAKAKQEATLANTVIRVFSDESGLLDLLPSELRLHEAEMMPRGKERKLKLFLDKARGFYDFIFIDCPPTISVFTLSAYLASDGYLVPIKPDPLSVVGLPLLERVVTDYASDHGHAIRQVGIIPTMLRPTNLMRDTLAGLRRLYGAAVFTNCTSTSTHVAASVDAHLPLFDMPEATRYGDEVVRIADEFLAAVT